MSQELKLFVVVGTGLHKLTAAWLVPNIRAVEAAWWSTPEGPNQYGAAWAAADDPIDVLAYQGDNEALIARVEPLDRDTVRDLLERRDTVLGGARPQGKD
jgi:hypothetical protein